MTDAVAIDGNVAVPMRDGVALRADVYRPDDATPHSVLFARLPSDKDLSPISLSLLSPIRAASIPRHRWQGPLLALLSCGNEKCAGALWLGDLDRLFRCGLL